MRVPKQKSEDQEKKEKLKKLMELEEQLKSMTAQEATVQTEDVSKQINSADDELAEVEKGISAGFQKQLTGEKTNSDDAEIDMELAKLEAEIASEQAVEEAKSTFEKVLELHPWLDEKRYGFMYAYPDPKKNKADFDSWLDEWTKVLFDYARLALEHIIYPKKLLTEEPFRRFEKPKNSLEYITEELVKKKLAAWLDKKKESLRVYWRSMEDWCSAIVKWARDHVMSDPILLPDIRNSGEEFAELPEEDVKKIFEMIEKQKDGQLVKLSKNEFAIKIKL